MKKSELITKENPEFVRSDFERKSSCSEHSYSSSQKSFTASGAGAVQRKTKRGGFYSAASELPSANSVSTEQPIQRQANKTGMPDPLQTAVESLSGMSFSDVEVHYNSPKPTQFKSLAYAQGNEIHLGPGQEKHLPHEAWHIVQQKQGRVQSTVQMRNTAINDDDVLEKEADIMGERAVQMQHIVDKKMPAATRSLVGSTGSVLQAKGFKSVNDAAPNENDATTGSFVKAGKRAWDPVFTGDKDGAVEQAGGVLGYFKKEKGAEFEAEAITRYEDARIQGDKKAFAKVEAKGDTEKQTTIKRWQKATRDVGSVKLAKNKYDEKKPQIKAVIAEELFGDLKYTESEPDSDWITDLELEDLDEKDNTVQVWAKKKPNKTGWLVKAFLGYLEQKITEYNGVIPKDVFHIAGCNDFSEKVIAKLKTDIALEPAVVELYEGADANLTIDEVLMHEFGHITAALAVTGESIVNTAGQLKTVNFETILGIIEQLDIMTKPNKGEAPDRKLITQLRFAWGMLWSAFFKTKQAQEAKSQEEIDLVQAVKILANILMSFEEYYNIEDIDNRLGAGSDRAKRIKHGTEIATGINLGHEFDDKAEAEKLGKLDPSAMSKAVWLNKLQMLIRLFKVKYGKYDKGSKGSKDAKGASDSKHQTGKGKSKDDDS